MDMGIYSTINITREDALNRIREQTANLETLTDERLARLLEDLYQGDSTGNWQSDLAYANYSIVPAYTGKNCDYPNRENYLNSYE